MKILQIALAWLLSFSLVFGASSNPNTEERKDGWTLNNFDPKNIEPTDLKYFKYYDTLPEEITLEVFKDQDLSHLKGKRLFVGYGLADPKGKNCVVLPVAGGETKEVCLPWWRIEREYKNLNDEGNIFKSNFFDTIKKPRPPLMVNVCDKTTSSKYYPGGNIVCTSYYDRLTDESCWNNPKQAKCYVDNCGRQIVDNCKFVETIVGEDSTLETAVIDKKDGNVVPTKKETKVGLQSHVFSCGGGSLTNTCESSKDVLMFPYECKLDDPATATDDGEYIYCDENSPVYDAGNEIVGFSGKCSDGKQVMCQVNRFQNSTSKCIQPIYETKKKYTNYEYETTRTYNEVSVDTLSGESDSYSANENCLRSNTIQDSRNQEIYTKIVGNGFLDDDIYVLRHREGGGFYKVYCNMQHAGATTAMATNLKACLATKTLTVPLTNVMTDDFLTCVTDAGNFGTDFIETCVKAKNYKIGTKPAQIPGQPSDPSTYLSTDDIIKIYDCGEVIKSGSATKVYDGIPLSCLRNNGNYSFNETIKINSSDIVSIQQNSEIEYLDGTPFSQGRNHYSSTKVVIDGVEAAPSTASSNFPHYPNNGSHLRTWDNTTATLSLLFPFAGAYELYFYNKNGIEIAKANIDMVDFREASASKAKQIQLGQKMKLASGINGYAGSEAIFLALAGFLLFSGNYFLVLAVAVLGFLFWNWNKAKIFMGDVGSTLLGYNIAIFTIYYANQEATNFWIWIILFGVYWFDATLTLVRRKLNK